MWPLHAHCPGHLALPCGQARPTARPPEHPPNILSTLPSSVMEPLQPVPHHRGREASAGTGPRSPPATESRGLAPSRIGSRLLAAAEVNSASLSPVRVDNKQGRTWAVDDIGPRVFWPEPLCVPSPQGRVAPAALGGGRLSASVLEPDKWWARLAAEGYLKP